MHILVHLHLLFLIVKCLHWSDPIRSPFMSFMAVVTLKNLLSISGILCLFKNLHSRKRNIVNDGTLRQKIFTTVRRGACNVLCMHITMFLLMTHTNGLNLLESHSKLFKWKGNKPLVSLNFSIGPRMTHPVQ